MRPPTATCRCCRPTSPSTCSCGPRSSRTSVTSDRRRGGSGCRSAPIARAMNGRRRPDPTAVASGRVRPGIEEMLAAHNLEYFVADSHLVAAGEPVFLYRDYLPLREPVRDVTPAPLPVSAKRVALRAVPRRLARRHRLGGGVHPGSAHDAAGVEPRAGLPGRATSSSSSTRSTTRAGCASGASPTLPTIWAASRSTTPKIAAEKIGLQATHFVELVKETVEHAAQGPPGTGVLALRLRAVRPLVVRGTALARAYRARDGQERRARDDARRGHHRRAAQGPLQLPEGSWGEGGDHRVWLNSKTEWTWDRVYSAEQEWVEQLRQGDGGHPELKRVLAQASRELLLLQASDWQFLITTGSARDYAERRVAEHYADFKRLSEMAHTRARRHAAVDRGGRDAAPARARGLHLPRSRSILGAGTEGLMARRRARVLGMIMAGGQGRAPASPHPRALQAVRALRGSLPHHRFRAVELRQLRDAGPSTCWCSTSRSR